MMTPRRVRRQDPEIQFADEPVRHPVAAGSPASRGPRYAAIICGRGGLVPEEPCVRPNSRPCTRRSAARPYKRQPPDHLRAGPSPVPSAARAARCAAHAPATDPSPGRSSGTAPPRLRPAATGGRSPSSTPRRAQGPARLDAVCGKRRLSTPAVVPAHQSLAPPRHPDLPAPTFCGAARRLMSSDCWFSSGARPPAPAGVATGRSLTSLNAELDLAERGLCAIRVGGGT